MLGSAPQAAAEAAAVSVNTPHQDMEGGWDRGGTNVGALGGG